MKTVLVWGDDQTTATAFATLLDEIRRGDLDGSVEEGSTEAVDAALAAGFSEEWSTEWALSVTADVDVIEDIEAAADLAPGVRGYARSEPREPRGGEENEMDWTLNEDVWATLAPGERATENGQGIIRTCGCVWIPSQGTPASSGYAEFFCPEHEAAAAEDRAGSL